MIRRHPRDRRPGEGGVALVTVLGILFIVSLLGILVMYLTGKEIILSRNQRSSTDAFYIADGGATTARRAAIVLIENLQSNANQVAGGTANFTTQLATMYANGQASQQNPIHLLDFAGFRDSSGTCCSTIPTGATPQTSQFTYIVTTPPQTYPTKWVAADTGTDVYMPLNDGSYVARITISRRLVKSAQYPTGVYIEQSGSVNFPTYTFHFTYTVQSRGVVKNSLRRIQLSRDFDVVVSPLTFANYVYFNNVFGTVPPPGTCNVGRGWFDSSYTFDGPVHTNERLWLAYQPTFGDVVDSANYSFVYKNGQCVPAQQASAGYVHFWDNGRPKDINLYCSPDPSCKYDNPLYVQGPGTFNRLSQYIPMPPNVFSQERASLGGNPYDTSPVSNQEINQALGRCTPTCPGSPPPTGVYVPVTNTGTQQKPNLVVTGGIYVQDTNLQRLSFSIDSANRQVVQFNQVVNNQTQVTTIVIDKAANQTTMTVKLGSSAPQVSTYSGVPNGMIYVSGSIAALGGRSPGGSSSCPADSTDAAYGQLGSCIQQDNQITVTAQGDITIDNHIRYQVDPRGPDGRWGTADDNMTVKNILGIYTATGNINIADPAPDNIVIDAFLMASQGEYQVIDYATRPPQGNANILGGKIINYEGYEGTMNYQGQIVSGYGLNLSFDRRTQAGTAMPPFFPLIQQYTATFPNLTGKPTWQELL
jgi:Tfp pilus assembly protein PilX